VVFFVSMLLLGAANYGTRQLLADGRICTWTAAGFLLLVLSAVLFCLYRRGLWRDYGLCPAENRRQVSRLCLPLLLLPLLNLAEAVVGVSGFSSSAYSVFSTVYSAFSEELLFRGMLPAAIAHAFSCRKRSAVLAACLVFSLFHLADGFPGGLSVLLLLQAVSAFGLGLCLCVFRELSDSILPGAVLHCLINLSAGNGSFPDGSVLTSWLPAAVLCTLYGLWLFIGFFRKKPYSG